MQWPKVHSSLAGLLDFCPIAHEAFESTVGQRMAHQLTEGFGGHGRRVSPQLDALEYVGWVAHRCGEDFGVKVVIGPSVHDFSDEFHAVMSGIVNASNERRNIRGSGFSGHERL